MLITMRQKNISIYILRATISLILIFVGIQTPAQSYKKIKKVQEKDTIPLFRGIAISTDLVGPLMLQLGDYGQYEAALKVNLKDKYFPTVEIGYGKANRQESTGINYKTSAPYFRIGSDFNILKNKHDTNVLYVGFRYAFTSYKNDISHADFSDPVWGYDVKYEASGNSCSYHWLEVVFGVDSKIIGPLHLGWSVRYKYCLSSDEGVMGKSWYVPGFGTSGSTRLGGTFNVIFDI